VMIWLMSSSLRCVSRMSLKYKQTKEGLATWFWCQRGAEAEGENPSPTMKSKWCLNPCTTRNSRNPNPTTRKSTLRRIDGNKKKINLWWFIDFILNFSGKLCLCWWNT
jgi:hypothetical protein